MRFALVTVVLLFFGASCSNKPDVHYQPPPEAIQEDTPPPEPRVRIINKIEHTFPQLFLSHGESHPGEVALKTNGLIITHKEYEAGFKNYQSTEANGEEEYSRRLQNELLLLAWLQDSGLAENPDFEARARSLLRSQLSSLVLDQAVSDAINVTPDEVRDYYDSHPEEFRQPHRVSVRVILVATMAEAEELLVKLEQGEDFGVLAQTQSLHTSGTSGGRMEPFARGTLSPQIEDVAFSLGTGEIGTASTPRGLWIIEKIADSPASMMPFDQVQESIQLRLLDQKRLRARTDFLQQLEQEYMSGGNDFSESASE